VSYQRELTMTVICKTCSNQYGKWRPRCPACGEPNTQPATFNAPRVVEPSLIPRSAIIKRQPKRECIACHQGGAKKTCPHCNELVHAACLVLHAEACAEFQVTLRESQRAHGLSV
jgi:predicted ATP-dependent serine protease